MLKTLIPMFTGDYPTGLNPCQRCYLSHSYPYQIYKIRSFTFVFFLAGNVSSYNLNCTKNHNDYKKILTV